MPGRDGGAGEQTVDCRPLGLGVAGWSGAWVATSGVHAWWWVALGIGVVVAGFAGRRRRWWALAVVIAAVASLGCGMGRVGVLQGSPLAAAASDRSLVEMDVVLKGQPTVHAATPTRPRSWMSDADVVAWDGHGRSWGTREPVQVVATGDAVDEWSGVSMGTRVRAFVKLSRPTDDTSVVALARAASPPEVIAEPSGKDSVVSRIRQGLRDACSGLGPDARALVPALVIGDTSGVSDDTKDAFVATGLTHVMAVSGANLVLFLAFVRAIVVACGVRGRSVSATLVITVVAFVALCLGEPSVVRAAAMGLVGLAALGVGARGRQGLRYLGVAIWFLTLWDPWLARSLGFALSAAASFGLLWWASRWTDALATWMPAPLAEAIAVPMAAQLATQPIVTAISGQVSLVGVLANAVAAPLVGPATVTGFLAAGLGVPLPPVAAACAWCSGWFATALAQIARLGASAPGATIGCPTAPWAVALVTVGCLVTGALLTRGWYSPVLVAVLAAAMVLAIVRTPTPVGWPPRVWSVVSCDVGQGDATVLRAGPDSAVVVDAGPDPALLRRCLDQLGVREVGLVVLTHLHADHVSGLPALTDRRVSMVITSAVVTPTYGERLVDDLARTASHEVTHAGDRWVFGGVTLDVISAPAQAISDPGTADEGESAGENDASLALMATVGGVRVLLAGDEQDAGQAALLATGVDLSADALLLPHHGSSRQDPRLVLAAAPQVVLISVAAKNDYGHPTKKALATAGAATPNIVRTDQHGCVALARGPTGLEVTVQRP